MKKLAWLGLFSLVLAIVVCLSLGRAGAQSEEIMPVEIKNQPIQVWVDEIPYLHNFNNNDEWQVHPNYGLLIEYVSGRCWKPSVGRMAVQFEGLFYVDIEVESPEGRVFHYYIPQKAAGMTQGSSFVYNSIVSETVKITVPPDYYVRVRAIVPDATYNAEVRVLGRYVHYFGGEPH